jgi:hypothetical protein
MYNSEKNTLFGRPITCPKPHPEGQTIGDKLWQPMDGHIDLHMFDPYSWCHFQWGIICALFGANFLMVNLVSIVFEIIENSPFMVSIFRGTTLYKDSIGDSITNISGDHLSVLAGWSVALLLPFKWLCYPLILLIEVLNSIINKDSSTQAVWKTLVSAWESFFVGKPETMPTVKI